MGARAWPFQKRVVRRMPVGTEGAGAAGAGAPAGISAGSALAGISAVAGSGVSAGALAGAFSGTKGRSAEEACAGDCAVPLVSLAGAGGAWGSVRAGGSAAGSCRTGTCPGYDRASSSKRAKARAVSRGSLTLWKKRRLFRAWASSVAD